MRFLQIIVYSTILIISSFGCAALKERFTTRPQKVQPKEEAQQGQTEQKRKVDPIPINPHHS